ncbi:MAG TPA: NAD(P)H-dependent oxidoreductase subunit E [Bacteroidales bacterium]|nr:NAD(P)H-dependent oxidoreductase subunit E [Bacteroidales bacterium]
MKNAISKTIAKYNKDKTRLMDILIDTQEEMGYIPKQAVSQIAEDLQMSEVDVEQTISFYHFFTFQPTGKYRIYLNNSAVAKMMGRKEVADTFEHELGIKFGRVTTDGLAGLFETSCIGMNDQEPAAIINNLIFTKLTPFRVKEIVHDIKEGKAVEDMFRASYGDGKNASELIRDVVNNNIRKIGPVLDPNYKPGEAIKKIIKMKPEEVIGVIKKSNMRGRGGAGFPTGLKWEFCRNIKAKKKYIFCNADEGEPGTFKDRVILTELPWLLIEGIVVAGYAVGATEGILYIRYEYKYLGKYLEKTLQKAREKKYLGKDIGGKKGFNFNIRIQFGAGAYVCGEESALIESAEGKRGEPRDRPPFPVESGYFNLPTVVNNVETLCSAVKVILNGSEWYKSIGTAESTGTKLLSISGDCRFPGIYEIEWGTSINDVLEMIGTTKSEVQAIQVGGPSGTLIGPNEFNRIFAYEDLATGGSLIIFNKYRDILNDVVLNFTEFFIEESCGSCSTCRIVPMILLKILRKILNGRGVMQDIEDMIEWSKIVRVGRCGLGQTAANPILSSIKNFRYLYEEKIQKNKTFDSGFDLGAAVMESCEVTNRIPNI